MASSLPSAERRSGCLSSIQSGDHGWKEHRREGSLPQEPLHRTGATRMRGTGFGLLMHGTSLFFCLAFAGDGASKKSPSVLAPSFLPFRGLSSFACHPKGTLRSWEKKPIRQNPHFCRSQVVYTR
ncbi:hypothetical protein MUK42_19256 [Musa troglodytarum]|uniref:Uncharacterized protein n=1 Tax=Musa troglodytarum TaxID=320322 RepID=A0A9E7FSI6_9LILI|nr:hypothetical protein MUK42_19256 [Musa troglodytarum]